MPAVTACETSDANLRRTRFNNPENTPLSNEVVTRLKDGSLSLKKLLQCKHHPQTADKAAVDWIFLIDTLNFCFWTPTGAPKWQVTWKGETHTGYFALCAAINRAIDEGYSITSPKYYSQITLKDLKHIFRGDDPNVEVPLLNERQQCLHQIGLALLEKFSGSFVNCINDCDNTANKLLSIIVDNFECFNDAATYNNQRVAIYKRAQILISDIWACFQGKDLGYFKDIDKISMFADYRIPQVLVHFKSMKYSDELLKKLEADTILENGSAEEVEIRGCSIHVVELVQKEVEKMLPDVKVLPTGDPEEIVCNSALIDHFLWDYRRNNAKELEVIPFHKTLSIYY